MSRTVSKPSNCHTLCYRSLYEIDDDIEYRWEELTDWIVETCTTHWPSLNKCAKWLGREDHAILENRHCYIGVSEYCGLVCIWLVPKDDYPDLSQKWCDQIGNKFYALFSEYKHVATFSNGEAVYERITTVN